MNESNKEYRWLRCKCRKRSPPNYRKGAHQINNNSNSCSPGRVEVGRADVAFSGEGRNGDCMLVQLRLVVGEATIKVLHALVGGKTVAGVPGNEAAAQNRLQKHAYVSQLFTGWESTLWSTKFLVIEQRLVRFFVSRFFSSWTYNKLDSLPLFFSVSPKITKKNSRSYLKRRVLK